MVGVSAEERALSKPWVGIRSRLPWLNINLLTAFLAAAVVGLFEDTIAKFTALAVLLPVVAGQSGNTGAQALAVTMRGLALREIRTSHAARVLGKELAIGFCNGLAIAVVTAIGVFIWSQSIGTGPRHVVRHVDVHDARVHSGRSHPSRAGQAGPRPGDSVLDHSHDRDRRSGLPFVFGPSDAIVQYAPDWLETTDIAAFYIL